MLPPSPTIAALEANNPAVAAAFAVTRIDITDAGLPRRGLEDVQWHRKQDVIWRRFVQRIMGCSPDGLDAHRVNVLRDLFSDLGAINTGPRIMAAVKATAPKTFDPPTTENRNRHGLARMKAERDRQLTGLKAASQLRSIAPQMDASALPLFAAGQQPSLF
ncbi:hypothetical protein [Sphingomonas sanguinis]|uniref:hypothetical protein n=1 Tax=Sphingomonas sanguinis TaxID=33051 RepID=UPI00077BD25C|nr:hypothetical protein [Sphingomonas sanguinis]